MYYFTNLYVSLTPLWLSILIKIGYKYFKVYNLNFNCTILRSHIFYTVFIFLIIGLLIISIIHLFIVLKKNGKSCSHSGYVKEYTIEKSMTMDYMFIYVLPLFAFDFLNKVDIVLFILYFTFVTILICKYKYFTGNIVCEIIGYKYYECKIVGYDDGIIEKVVMSKREILKGDDIYIYDINNEVSIDLT